MYWEGLLILIGFTGLSLWLTGCTIIHTTSQGSRLSRILPTPNLTITVDSVVTSSPTSLPTSSIKVALQSTPPPSPTPHHYTIQENDTLLGVALQFGVELNDLRAANPQVDPQTLQIGQALQIPLPAHLRREQVLTQAEVVPPLTIPAPRCYSIVPRGTVCLGRIDNTLAETVEHLTVTVELFNSLRQPIDKRTHTLEQMRIMPDQFAPYRVLFPETDLETIDHLVVTLTRGRAVNALDTRFVPLTLEDEQVIVDDRAYTVDLYLFNSSQYAVRPRVIVTLVDADTQAIHGYRVWETLDTLAPKTRTRAMMTVMPVGVSPAVNESLMHHIRVESLRVDAASNP